jgi:radical SAM superfamily enzyme
LISLQVFWKVLYIFIFCIYIEGVRKLFIYDGTFSLNPHCLEICSHIAASRNIRRVFIDVNVELLDEEIIKIFKKAGAALEIGLQTISPTALRNIKRSWNREKFVDNIRLLKTHGVPYVIDMIRGLPGDNYFSFMAGMKFALKQDPMRCIVNPLYILPGTRLQEDAEEFEIHYSPSSYLQYGNRTWSLDESIPASIASAGMLAEYQLAYFNKRRRQKGGPL